MTTEAFSFLMTQSPIYYWTLVKEGILSTTCELPVAHGRADCEGLRVDEGVALSDETVSVLFTLRTGT